ncbi:hypothetical protein GCM10025872_36350 [Barrientosiimonas endolithica]|uniref:Penicillin-binding protein transpeptidase domain-containing protein n=1 Tax=Barrientosiimonas endolithica TaxID=1535208 RepID=A0ABM8HG31_9MICO|nr:hypothetical protein GCM10025872_36350 [Barrientosiimonas endolithica]
MNSPIRRIGVVAAAMFLSLLLASTMIQFVQAEELNTADGNRRTLLDSYSRERGSILVGSTPVAQSSPTEDDLQWQRSYPQAKLYAPVTGYYSFTYGSGNGIEDNYDSMLSGTADALFYRRIGDVLTGKPPQGASVELTIDPAAQKAAYDALGNQRGAVIALDPKTGAILAMVSKPSYDPNLLASHDLRAVSRNWEQLSKAPNDPMINRTIRGDLYPPGSTFKLVTAAAALESGQYTPSPSCRRPRAWTCRRPRSTCPTSTASRAARATRRTWRGRWRSPATPTSASSAWTSGSSRSASRPPSSATASRSTCRCGRRPAPSRPR